MNWNHLKLYSIISDLSLHVTLRIIQSLFVQQPYLRASCAEVSVQDSKPYNRLHFKIFGNGRLPHMHSLLSCPFLGSWWSIQCIQSPRCQLFYEVILFLYLSILIDVECDHLCLLNIKMKAYRLAFALHNEQQCLCFLHRIIHNVICEVKSVITAP